MMIEDFAQRWEAMIGELRNDSRVEVLNASLSPAVAGAVGLMETALGRPLPKDIAAFLGQTSGVELKWGD